MSRPTRAVRLEGRSVVQLRSTRSHKSNCRRFKACCASLADDEQRWEKELQVLRQRAMQPNQLEALAKEIQTADIGRVLALGDGLATVSGIDSDAPVGAAVVFSSGAKGVLLWWHDESICIVLVLAGEELVGRGDGAQCNVIGVLQVVDEEEGAQTKPEFEMYQVPVGKRMVGKVVNHLGICREGDPHMGAPRLPLLNEQVSMQNREVISEPLMLGIKCMDVLTPMARGSAMLLVGPRSVAKWQVALDVICNLRDSGVVCVYAAVGCSAAELDARIRVLQDAGALGNTAVVAATRDESLGRQFAAMCTALSIGESVRNEGGAALVLLDSLESMPRLWTALMQLTARCVQPAAPDTGSTDNDEDSTDESKAFDLVEYEGMLLSAAAAQRRRFFSSLMQRPAKMHRRLGGGSLSLLMCLDGVPATGVRKRLTPSIASYKHLSDAQKAKLAAALSAQLASREDEEARSDVGVAVAGDEASASTEVVEELMSISDGQVVVQRRDEGMPEGLELDCRQSLSRMGVRAYHPALQELAPQVRLDLAQANDAARFAEDQSERQQALQRRRAGVTRAALVQPPGSRSTLGELVCLLWVLQQGVLDDVAVEQVPTVWQQLWSKLQADAAEAVEHIQTTKKFTAASKRAVTDVCQDFFRR